MADTLNDSLVKVTEELKEANTRSLEASKELGKVTAASKASYTSIGAAVKESVGFDKLKDTFANLPGMNVAKAVKDVIMKKRREKQEQVNLAKRLGITSDQLQLQKAEQEVVLARREESTKLIEAAEKLGFNTDRIAQVNEQGRIELNGSLRESNGQFVSKTNASADANLRALKDFSKIQEKEVEDNKPEPKTKREDFSPVEETSLDKTTLEKLATEDTLMMVADKLGSMITAPSLGSAGAAATEDAAEQRRLEQANLDVAEQTNKLLSGISKDSGDGEDGKKEGGFFSNLLAPLLAFKASIVAIPAMFSSVIAGISAFGAALAPLALPILAVVAGIVAAIGFIKGFMEGFSEGGIFGGLKEGMMKLFDWFIGLPVKILKDITVWALNALGMESLASALDAFPLVESLRKMFSFIIDLIVVPIGFVMDTIGGIFGGLFEIIMAPIRAFGTAIMAVFDSIDNIFGGIMMIFSGDITGGFQAIFDGVKSLIMAPINFVIDTVKSIFGGLFSILMAPFNALKGAIGFIFGPQSALGGVFSWLSETLGGLWETITAPFTSVMTFLSDLFSFPTSFGDGLMKLVDIIFYPINLAVNFVKGLFGFGDPDKPFKLSEFILDTVKGVWDWFTGLFKFDGSVIMDGIMSIGTIMKGLAKGGFAAIKAILPGGESPGEAFSRVYNEVSSGGEAAMPDSTTIDLPPSDNNSFEGISSTISAVGNKISGTVMGIEIPTFGQASGAVSNMATGLGNKVSSMWGSVSSLFSTADAKQAEIDEANAFQEARSSGLYNENYIGKSVVDESKIKDASDVQLKAILAHEDMSEKQTKLVQDELTKRQETGIAETEIKQRDHIGRTIGSTSPSKDTVSAPTVKFQGENVTKQQLIDMRKNGDLDYSNRAVQISYKSAITKLNMLEKKNQLPEGASQGTFEQGKLVEPVNQTDGLGTSPIRISDATMSSANSAIATSKYLSSVQQGYSIENTSSNAPSISAPSAIDISANTISIMAQAEKIQMLQDKGMENNSSNQIVNIVNANDMSSNTVSAGGGSGGGSRPIFSATSGDKSQVSNTLNNRH